MEHENQATPGVQIRINDRFELEILNLPTGWTTSQSQGKWFTILTHESGECEVAITYTTNQGGEYDYQVVGVAVDSNAWQAGGRGKWNEHHTERQANNHLGDRLTWALREVARAAGFGFSQFLPTNED